MCLRAVVDRSGPNFVPRKVEVLLLLECMIEDCVDASRYCRTCSVEILHALRDDGHRPRGSSGISVAEIVVRFSVYTQDPFEDSQVC